ncbi:MAG TPA: TadE/TadG family type IV pilus assembly protein [Anaerolineales bacterium]|nr:TadE/TadG family type IV pilus assembly protein [Anaerolineales bacterium]
MVEFALVFPIILLITYGIMEFGRMIWIYAAVTGAAREGARYGAASGLVDTNNDGVPDRKRYAYCPGIREAVKRTAVLVPITDADITISYDNGPSPTAIWNTCPPLNGYGLDPILLGDRVVVRVNFTYQPVISFLQFNGFAIHSRSARTILLNVEMGP